MTYRPICLPFISSFFPPHLSQGVHYANTPRHRDGEDQIRENYKAINTRRGLGDTVSICTERDASLLLGFPQDVIISFNTVSFARVTVKASVGTSPVGQGQAMPCTLQLSACPCGLQGPRAGEQQDCSCHTPLPPLRCAGSSPCMCLAWLFWGLPGSGAPKAASLQPPS